MRPLSKLQEAILLLANKAYSVRSHYKVDTSICQVLIEVYGFPSDGSMARAKAPVLVFNRKVVGVRRYQSGYAVVSKAFDRLVTRGLAKKDCGQGYTCGYGQGIKLTSAGVSMAEGIRQQRYRARR